MSTRISHSGIVDSICDECVRVRILQTTACSACHVAGRCHAADSKEKIIDVYDMSNSVRLKPGDAVTVYTSRKMVSRALLMGFGIPFLLLVVVLICTLWFTKDEGISAVVAIFALVPYYMVLYSCRDNIKQKVTFYIE